MFSVHCFAKTKYIKKGNFKKSYYNKIILKPPCPKLAGIGSTDVFCAVK